MSSYFFCTAYSDLQSTMGSSHGLVHIALCSRQGENLYLSMTPMQAFILAAGIRNIAGQVRTDAVCSQDPIGSLEIQFEENHDPVENASSAKPQPTLQKPNSPEHLSPVLCPAAS